MRWLASLIALLGLAVASESRAVEVATYGAGLVSCGVYLDTRSRQESSDQVQFVDWLVGYFSGANTTSTRRNNLLGLSDVSTALLSLDRLCRAKPESHFADAAGLALMASNSTPGAHSVEVTKYGSGFRLCTAYIASRQPQSFDSDEFINWLGGYLSGANAIALKTNDVLGHSDLTQAVYWLDDYCTAHPMAQFSSAVNALIESARKIEVARH